MLTIGVQPQIANPVERVTSVALVFQMSLTLALSGAPRGATRAPFQYGA